jgi:hypothetical protein
MTQLTDRLQSIRNNYTGLDYIAHVKTAVADEMCMLDPTMRLVDTHYFNHSAIPDFVIGWPHERAERRIYLRGSYASIVALDDVQNLQTGDPILLSLTPEQHFAEPDLTIGPDEIRSAASSAAHTLVTDAAAVAGIAESDVVDSSPLAALVRANFARGGRGLIDVERANALVSVGNGPGGVTAELESSFFNDAVVRMRRTAELIALSREGQFERRVADIGVASGRLSRAEMEQLVPWLLNDPDTTRDARFWRYLGSLMTFQDLESLCDLVGAADLTPLVMSNSTEWFSSRGYLGLAIAPDDRAEDATDEGVWRFRGKVVGVDVGTSRLQISTDGRTLKGRANSRLPLWSDIAPILPRFRLQEVGLRGVDRSISVSAEQSDNITEDVESIARSVDDRYYVSELKVRYHRPDAEPAIGDVLFDRGIVSSGSHELKLREIAELCASFLGYADPELGHAVDRTMSGEARS